MRNKKFIRYSIFSLVLCKCEHSNNAIVLSGWNPFASLGFLGFPGFLEGGCLEK